MSKPITELDFPAVTICKGGQNMGAVREAMDRDRRLWEGDNSRRKRATGDDHYCMDRSLCRILGFLFPPSIHSHVILDLARAARQ